MRLELIFMMRDIYINSNLNPLTKFTSSSRRTEFQNILSCNINQMIMKTIAISTISLCHETGHPVLSLMERQWELRQPHDQNFPMEGKPLYNKY